MGPYNAETQARNGSPFAMLQRICCLRHAKYQLARECAPHVGTSGVPRWGQVVLLTLRDVASYELVAEVYFFVNLPTVLLVRLYIGSGRKARRRLTV
jgi:hypothetical protein